MPDIGDPEHRHDALEMQHGMLDPPGRGHQAGEEMQRGDGLPGRERKGDPRTDAKLVEHLPPR